MKIGWGHLLFASWVVVASTAVSTAPQANPALPSKAFVDTYCATCHNQRLKTAGLVFDTLDVTKVAAAPA
jgi:cytochrome c5